MEFSSSCPVVENLNLRTCDLHRWVFGVLRAEDEYAPCCHRVGPRDVAEAPCSEGPGPLQVEGDVCAVAMGHLLQEDVGSPRSLKF